MKLVWRSYFIGIIMEKGLLVDIGRKYWSIAELKRLVLLLQEHKLTHLQLHLNENEGFALNFTDSPVSISASLRFGVITVAKGKSWLMKRSRISLTE